MLARLQACAPAVDAPLAARASDHLPLVADIGDGILVGEADTVPPVHSAKG